MFRTSVTHWLESLRRAKVRRKSLCYSRARRRVILNVEQLEGRAVPSSFSFLQLTDTLPTSGGGFHDISLSADGTRIVFTSINDLTGGNPDGNGEVFLYDTTTETFTQVTHTNGFFVNNWQTSLSGDGQHIAFSSFADLTGGNPDGNRELFLYEVATGAFTQVTDTTLIYSDYPSLNHDGTRVAFHSTADLTGENPYPNQEIFLYDIASDTFTQVTHGAPRQVSHSPLLSGDGTELAFTSQGANFLYDIASETFTRVGDIIPVAVSSPSLSGDGSQFIYFSGSSYAFLYDVATDTVTRITLATGQNSSDSSLGDKDIRIAFSSQADPTGGNPDGNRELFLFDVATDTLTQVTHTTGTVLYTALLSADGTRIVFDSNADLTGGNPDGNSEIFMAVEGENQPPLAADDDFSGMEDVSVGGNVLSDNGHGPDLDPNGHLLTVNPTPVAAPDHGSLVLNADGSFTYTPNLNFNGTDQFVYEVSDGQGGTATATVTIAIEAVNDPPTVVVPGAQTTPEDVSIVIQGIEVSDIDLAEGTGEMQVTLSVSSGTITVIDNVTGGLTADQITANGTGTVILTGTPDAINATLAAGVTYLGDIDFKGTETLAVIANDLGNTGTGGPWVTTATVTIQVLSPEEQITDLIRMIDALFWDGVLNSGQATSLRSHLDFDDNLQATLNSIDSFILEVEALILGDILTNDQGGGLIAAALDLRTSYSTG
jgi:VCBS repeat-containing protein